MPMNLDHRGRLEIEDRFIRWIKASEKWWRGDWTDSRDLVQWHIRMWAKPRKQTGIFLCSHSNTCSNQSVTNAKAESTDQAPQRSDTGGSSATAPPTKFYDPIRDTE